jgi:hypothetical protein
MPSIINKKVKNALFHMITKVKQHWAWIVLGWETLQGISGSSGTPKRQFKYSQLSFVLAALPLKKEGKTCH